MLMAELGLGIAFLTDNVDLGGTNLHTIRIVSDNQVMKIHVAACFAPSENPAADEFMDYLEQEVKSKA